MQPGGRVSGVIDTREYRHIHRLSPDDGRSPAGADEERQTDRSSTLYSKIVKLAVGRRSG